MTPRKLTRVVGWALTLGFVGLLLTYLLSDAPASRLVLDDPLPEHVDAVPS